VISVAIKTIIELQAKPGKRDELVRTMDRLIVTMRDVPGFLAITRQEVLEDPNKLVEIAEWDTPEARQTWLDRSTESGDLGPLMEILGALFKATNVRQIDSPDRGWGGLATLSLGVRNVTLTSRKDAKPHRNAHQNSRLCLFAPWREKHLPGLRNP
jgi:quinol monooxygenase YgiN